MTTALLSSTYFGPVQWYQKLHRYDRCLLERHDNFVKQTYRNRCTIATTAGTQSLTVPMERTEGLKCPMRDVRISDHGDWRRLHWNAIRSAYGESPFFDYYADDLQPFFTRRWEFLFDFNLEITMKVCELLDVRPTLSATEAYADADTLAADPDALATGHKVLATDTDTLAVDDFREAIRPKHPLPDESFVPKPYYQVYGLKHGFLPNLSILDLLFNEGNEAILYL